MYREIAKTKRYAIVECPAPGLYRIENRKGLYADKVPHIEIPKDHAEYLQDILEEYKDYPKGEKREAKWGGITTFEEICDRDFENEEAELYPEDGENN